MIKAPGSIQMLCQYSIMAGQGLVACHRTLGCADRPYRVATQDACLCLDWESQFGITTVQFNRNGSKPSIWKHDLSHLRLNHQGSEHHTKLTLQHTVNTLAGVRRSPNSAHTSTLLFHTDSQTSQQLQKAPKPASL